MTSYIIGRDTAELRDRAARVAQIIPALRSLNPEQVLENRKQAWFVGTPHEIAEQMREYAKLGVDLFMLQHFLLDDGDALRLLAEEVIPSIA